MQYYFYRYIYYKQLNNHFLSAGIKIESVYNNKITFFGYYNIIPVNNENEVVFCSVLNENKKLNTKEKLEILYKNHDGNIKRIASSFSWNWQQGCMLQWLPLDYNNIIYNDYDRIKDIYVSKVIDKKGKVLRVYNKPISYVSRSGQYALSLNYDRIASMNFAYGYFSTKNRIIPPDHKDGIWHLDLMTGKNKLIISIEQLKNLNYNDSMDFAMHKVNHIDINPSGTRFIFLHRWKGPKGRFHRLISANPDGSDIFIINGDRMTSHCCWIDDRSIISFCYINKFGEGYYIFSDKTSNVSLVSEKLPKTDGHPSVSPNKKWLITDTYPDKARMSRLILYNILDDTITNLGRFYQPFRYKNINRIDLHPKWSLDGKYLFFESGHRGRRQLYKLNIEQVTKN